MTAGAATAKRALGMAAEKSNSAAGVMVVYSRFAGRVLMRRSVIAVIGDASKSKQPELAKKAAEDIGAELARRDFECLFIGRTCPHWRWLYHENRRAACLRLKNS
jgi:hypothetical protein